MSAEARPDASGLRARAALVLGRIAEAARRAGRLPEEVTLVAVSKTHPAALVREAAAAGLRDFGENRVQEAESKIDELKAEAPHLRWHLIGHLQPNKARRAARLFDLIHTVDSAALVGRLERICAEDGRDALDVLVQVDLAGEETKSGVTERELPAVFDALEDCKRVRCRGLMVLPPFFEDAGRVRPFFRKLRELRDEWRARGAFIGGGEGAGELSMGMSHDFEVAIEEGATLVRVGTAVFGGRGVKVYGARGGAPRGPRPEPSHNIMDTFFSAASLFVWYAIATVILVVIALMLARLILNKADLNPFSRPVIMIRRWTDPMVNPVRRPLVQMGFSPNVAPLVVILVAILLGYFASQFIGTVLGTAAGLIRSVMFRSPISFIGWLIFGALAMYSLMIFARIILSWGVSPHNRLLHFLIRATEPLLGPFRRVIPPLGMMDISPIVVLFLLDLLQRAVAATLLRV